MDFETIFLYRFTERIAVILSATLLMWLGWRLFFIVSQKSDAEISLGDFKLIAKSFAPGTFFALFGAALMFYSITSPLEITEGIGTNVKEATTASDQPQTSRELLVRYMSKQGMGREEMRALWRSHKFLNEISHDLSPPPKTPKPQNPIVPSVY